MKDLVKITEEDFGVILDLRYATTNNVCNQKLYSHPTCYLHKDTIIPLKRAINLAKNLGLKLKIFDAFRPMEVQEFMYNKFPGDFVSNPKTGLTPHCRGAAIDLTLADLEGNELEMGSDFDEFSDLSFHNCERISNKAKHNRLLFLGLMTSAGFDFFSKEWWHYQLFNLQQYPIVNPSPDMIDPALNQHS